MSRKDFPPFDMSSFSYKFAQDDFIHYSDVYPELFDWASYAESPPPHENDHSALALALPVGADEQFSLSNRVHDQPLTSICIDVLTKFGDIELQKQVGAKDSENKNAGSTSSSRIMSLFDYKELDNLARCLIIHLQQRYT